MKIRIQTGTAGAVIGFQAVDIPGFHIYGPGNQHVFVDTRRKAELVKRVFETEDTRTDAGFDAMTDAIFGCEPLWWDTEAS